MNSCIRVTGTGLVVLLCVATSTAAAEAMKKPTASQLMMEKQAITGSKLPAVSIPQPVLPGQSPDKKNTVQPGVKVPPVPAVSGSQVRPPANSRVAVQPLPRQQSNKQALVQDVNGRREAEDLRQSTAGLPLPAVGSRALPARSQDPAANSNPAAPVPGLPAKPRANVPAYDSRSGNFRYGDGFQVRGTDPGGNRGKVGPGGVIQYGDGTRVSHDPATGDSKVVRPDGSADVRRGGSSGPHYDNRSGNFVYGDGYQVRGTDPQGNRGKIGAGGEIHFSDGTRVSHDPVSGDSKIIRPDGSVDVRPGGGQASPGHNTRFNSEQNAFDFGDGYGAPASRNGTPGKILGNGDIQYGDGSIASHDTATGDSKLIRPNGPSQIDLGGRGGNNGAGGTSYNSQQDAFDFGDGYGAPTTLGNGATGKILGNGDILYSDGSVVSHDRETGDTKWVSPDGTARVAPGERSGRSQGSSQASSSSSSQRDSRNNQSSKPRNNSGSSNSNSNASNDKPDKPADKPTDKPADKPTDKPSGKDKGYVLGGTRGEDTGKGTRLAVDQGSLVGSPQQRRNGFVPSAYQGKVKPVSRDQGPGGRPADGTSTPPGTRLPVDRQGLVTNPAGGPAQQNNRPLSRDQLPPLPDPVRTR